MIQKHTKEILKEVEIIDEIICNKCGQKIGRPMGNHQEDIPDSMWNEYIVFNNEFGFFSNIFSDGERHEFHLCEQCYANIISDFKIPPEKQHYLI